MLNKSSKNSRQKIVYIGKSLFVVSEKRKTTLLYITERDC